MKKKILKHLVCGVLTFCIIIFIIFSITPITFARDGLLTMQYVKSYADLYDMDCAFRHDANVKNIYLLYWGFEDITLEGSRGEKIDIEKIFPFLYRWAPNDIAFRLTIGERKCYVIFAGT